MVRYGKRTALLVVDLQNDFADPRGSLYVRGGEDVVPFVNAELARARKSGALVVYTQDWHPPDTPHFAKDGGVWPVHCVRNTRGARFHKDLDVDGEVVRKGADGKDGYSGFTVRDPRTGATDETRLGSLLKDAGVRRVVVAGLATDYCVKDTAIDAAKKGFHTTVLARGIRPVDLNPGDGSRAIAAMRRAGVVIEA